MAIRTAIAKQVLQQPAADDILESERLGFYTLIASKKNNSPFSEQITHNRRSRPFMAKRSPVSSSGCVSRDTNPRATY